jgi:fibro-slime domain-containing protein
MVTYYFAECNYTDTKANEDNVAMSDPEGSYDDIDAEKHEGLRIHYWNNSAYKTDDDKISGQYEGWTDVVKKVKVNGSNSIYVNTSALAGVNFSGLHEFYVYSVELPIWATSFCYVGISDGQEADPLPARSVISNGSTTVASKALNPNRINLLFRYNECRYARAVVLDESLWDKSTMEATKNNEVNTKLFSANAVKYNIDDDSITNDDFNTELNNYYSENYEHPLFIGSFRNITSFLNNKNYKMWDNLANQIDGNKSYFASIQGLTYPTLSNSKTNAMGNGYLLGYDGSILPLFNYELLKSNSNLATSVYEDLEFPFYETTFNGITTYSYDSFTDRNRVINEDGNFQVGNYVTAKGTYGYMPFAKANENNQTVNKYGLATEFDINFYMTSTGYLQDINNNKQDISFNFAGDDDVWVYIDGVLALDLGGAHGVSSGTIDFTQMKVYYKTAADNTDSIGSRGQGVNDNFSTDANYIKTLDLREIFLASGIEFNKTDSSTEHTLQMFYMERGGGESNCSINFNLPQTTGLKVVNNVSVKNVNTGLQSDTRTAANSDYFTYSIANRVPTSEEQNVYTAQGAKELKIDGSIMNVSTPVYPVVTDDIIKRSLNGTEYVLAVKNKSGTLSTFYWDKLSVDNFYTLSDVNYILSDSYVNTDDDSTEVTGRINKNGNFNLLFNQTANFEDKIPNNTLLQIAQSDTLYTVNSGSDTTAMTAESESTRTVSSYYKTSYVIYDNDSNEVLGSSSVTTTNKSGKDIYADDNIENGVENAFYFSNYSKEDTSSSNATTVTFNNEVATGKIKVTKEVESTENTYDVKDNFYFTLELSDLFGVSSSSKEYPGLEYTVYDAETNTIVYTRTYGKAGIYFNASQYVVVEGIPVGTNYTLEEKTKAGYQFSKAVRTLLNNDNTVISQAQSKSKSVSFYVPDITESNYDTTNQIDYTNSKVDFAITFKYYDRETKNGTTAHISETPSKIDVPIDNISQYQQENAEGEQSLRLTKMIEDAAKKINVDNVIDEYTVFQSQEAAVKAISQKLDITANTTYGNEFADDLSLLNNHFDCYGRVQGAENCLTSDGEGWVTYYNGSEVLTEEEAQNTQKITSITVWLYNTLKIYKPTFNVAKESSDLSQKGDVWVSNGNSSATLTQPVYYNMRLGGSNHNTTLDAACDYLQNYGITTSYVYQIPETAETIDDLQFLYWASDKEGKNILTTDFEYGYRITNNFKAYAVYGKNAVENIGLTLTANSPDYFTDNNGNNKIRLNNIMNPYNCPTKDDNIKDVSIVYIVDYTEDNKVNALLEQGGIDSLRDKIQEIIKKYQNKSSFNQGMTFEIEGITFNNDAEITGLVYEVVPYGTQVTTGTNQVALNNKNRLQFTTTFWIDDIYSTNMYAFAAMNYKGEDGSTWIVSDNCIHYSFDENSILTSIDDPIGKVMYYTSLKEEEE